MAASRAEFNSIQLAAAIKVGLTVPQTLITSEPHTAYAWAKELGEPSPIALADGL